jgi:hypothetical protein
MIARLRDEPIPLRKIRPELVFPEAVERVLQRALQRNPDDRFASAVEFADAFAAASANGSSPADGLLGKLFGR